MLGHTEVTFLLLLKLFRPDVWIMVEQPKSSFMPKMPEFKKAVERWGLQKYNTFLGAFGHDMLKHTHNCGPACPLWSAVSASAPKRRSKNIRTAWNARLSVCADVVKRRQSIGRSSLVESIRVERI